MLLGESEARQGAVSRGGWRAIGGRGARHRARDTVSKPRRQHRALSSHRSAAGEETRSHHNLERALFYGHPRVQTAEMMAIDKNVELFFGCVGLGFDGERPARVQDESWKRMLGLSG